MQDKIDSLFTLPNVLAVLHGIERNGSGYLALCPVHNDSHPSLAVSQGKNGDAVVVCRSQQCDVFPAILEKIKEQKQTGSLRPFPTPALPAAKLEKPRTPNVSEEEIQLWAGALQHNLKDNHSAASEYFNRRGISGQVLADLNIGTTERNIAHTNDKEQRKACPDCTTPVPVVVIPRYRNGELRGVKYRSLAPVPRHKWSQAVGSTTCQFLYDLDGASANFFSDVCFVAEGEHEALLLRSLNFNATAIFGTPGVPKELAGEFAEDLEKLKATFSYIILIPDGGNEAGIKVMARISNWLGSFPHSTVPVPGFKDAGDFFQAKPDVCREWLKTVEATRGVTQIEPPRAGELFAPSVDSFEDEPIQWLWPGFIPEKLTILAGAPGTGKSTLAYSIAAIVSAGGKWPDGTQSKAGRVLLWSSEDTPNDIIKPRLTAAGAELGNINILQSTALEKGERRPFDPAIDMPGVCQLVDTFAKKDDLKTKLLVIDPIVSAVTGDMHKANDVRRALQHIIDFAGNYGISVIGITHFAKGTSGKATTERVLGSQAFAAAPRMVLVTAKEESSGECVIVRSKSNIAPDTGGFRYSLQQHFYTSGRGERIETTRAVWGDPVQGTAREILNGLENPGHSSKSDHAAEFLREIFANERVLSRQFVFDRAKAENIGRDSIRQAAEDLGIKSSPGGYGKPWNWTFDLQSDLSLGGDVGR